MGLLPFARFHVFTEPRSISTETRCPRHVRYSPDTTEPALLFPAAGEHELHFNLDRPARIADIAPDVLAHGAGLTLSFSCSPAVRRHCRHSLLGGIINTSGYDFRKGEVLTAI